MRPQGASARPAARDERVSYPEGLLDERAARLAGQLDRRYLAWTDELPPALRTLARQASTYTGSPSAQPFAGVSSMNPGLTGTPWLFGRLFARLGDDTLLAIAGAGAFVVLASMVLDHLVDGQLEGREMLTLLHSALQQAGAERFRRLFPDSVSFWAYYERFSAEHLAGLATEVEARRQPASLTRERFEGTVPGKFAPIVVTLAALAEAAGRPDAIASMEASVKRLAVASQLLDDIGDAESDHAARHLTYYLAQLAPAERWLAPAWPDLAELRARIDATWHDTLHLRLVLNWLASAVEAVKGLDCPAWLTYLEYYRDLADRHLTASSARHLARSLRPLLPQPPA